jgi:hypothetical protein
MKFVDVTLSGIIVVAILGSASLAQTSAPQNRTNQVSSAPLFHRDWAFGDVRDMVLRFQQCGNQLCATIVALGEAGDGGLEARDVRNPNPALRSRSVCGLQLFSGVTRTQNGWTKGRAYNPAEGDMVGVTLIESRGSYELKVNIANAQMSVPLVPAPTSPIRGCPL